MTQKFALIPKYVKTWRTRQSYAIIWLQSYYKIDYNYCTYLGLFSYEF